MFVVQLSTFVVRFVKGEVADVVLHDALDVFVGALLEEHRVVSLGGVGQDLSLLVHVVDVIGQHVHALLALLRELVLVVHKELVQLHNVVKGKAHGVVLEFGGSL